MSEDYVPNYIAAIVKPLPELNKTFEAELTFLIKNSKKNYVAIDVGCGAGRPANKLAHRVQELICIDNDSKMLTVARQNCSEIKNIKILKKDALKTGFSKDAFDLTYATYNLIGSLKKEQRQDLINEMTRITKKGHKIINITWKDNNQTTAFLRKYYPSIGIKILLADNTKTITSKGTFERISKQELIQYYKNANLKHIKISNLGPVWLAVTGTK